MHTSYTIAERIRKQLLDQGYISIVVENRLALLKTCYLTKKILLPEIISDTEYLKVPLIDDHALDIINKHLEGKNYILYSLPNIKQLHSTKNVLDTDYRFEIAASGYLIIYKRGQQIDCIDIRSNRFRRMIFLDVKPLIEELVITKSYFSLPFGYSLIRFLQKNLPFQAIDFTSILRNYEIEEVKFEIRCADLGVHYVPNMNLSDKLDFLEGNLGKEAEIAEYEDISNFEHYVESNIYYKLSQLEFIVTNPLGELYEPLKFESSI
jgi:hypothetical protein